jgi:hypothetical protein
MSYLEGRKQLGLESPVDSRSICNKYTKCSMMTRERVNTVLEPPSPALAYRRVGWRDEFRPTSGCRNG